MSDAPMTDEAVQRLRQEREAFVERVPARGGEQGSEALLPAAPGR